jgi:hypothetical protein
MSHVVLLLYFQCKKPWYPVGQSVGGPQSRSGSGEEEKHLLTFSGIEPGFLSRPASNLVTISIELSQLLTEMVRERNIADLYGTGESKNSSTDSFCLSTNTILGNFRQYTRVALVEKTSSPLGCIQTTGAIY